MMQGFNPNRPSNTRREALTGAIWELIEQRESKAPAKLPNGELAAGLPSPPDACPDPGEWLRLAAGEIAPAESYARLAHAGLCRACAKRLRLSLLVHSEEVTPEEAAELGQLDSTSVEGRRRLAAHLALTARISRRGSLAQAGFWTGVGVAASLLIAAPLVLWWQQANSPERMLAQAYGRTRVFALRMPGAAYSAISAESHLRGGSSGREPADLLDARARIESRLERDPHNPQWLELEARSDVLEENFDPAIDILDRVIAAGPVTPGLLADAGAAYFERGLATGSENDRATALDYLRRADELAPADPVVLFNEAVAMEDRGQVMNAVETWNRYLRFERDPAWLAEGRSRLSALEQKLNRMKTHQSRMEQRLATPAAMRVLAADPATLAAFDEELSSTLLPKLLFTAFPLPARMTPARMTPAMDRSRGSPCPDDCLAARTLLQDLAASLERNHQDSWLTRFLPSESHPPSLTFARAAQALGKAIDANLLGDFPAAAKLASQSQETFDLLGDAAGRDRAQIERSYALQRSDHLAECSDAAGALLRRDPRFAWIQISAGIQEAICNTGPGTAKEDTPIYDRILHVAHDHGYTLLEFRALTGSAGSATESGDAEATWRIDLEGIRRFYAGDYPPLRVMNLLVGPAEVEQTTPRVHLDLLLKREVVSVLELTESRNTIPAERLWLAATAIRAGAAEEAENEMRLARSEQASLGNVAPFQSVWVESEIAMANLYFARGELSKAAESLEAAQGLLAGDDNFYHRRAYATARGQLELADGHPEAAESTLRDAILEEERQAVHIGAGNVIFALQNRDLYAILAGVWLKQNRPGEDILALWERYRLRILGKPVPACLDRRLDCLKPEVSAALEHLGQDRLTGQIVLSDRVLQYQAGAKTVRFSSLPIGSSDVLAAASALERAASSLGTSRDSVDQAARRIGDILFPQRLDTPEDAAQLLLESDPLLGNLPWPAVEISGQPIGLKFNVEETPSLLLSSRRDPSIHADAGALIIGASSASGELSPLPDALNEAREVAGFVRHPNVLLAGDATESQVAAGLANAPAIHFAGHAVERYGTTRLPLAPGKGSAGRDYLDSVLFRKYPPRAARLAVFSACATGKREEGGNHDMGDIVDTLAALGVPEVIATRWQIDSSSAVPMMDAFYSGLSQGLSVSGALTRARLSLSRDPRYQHPYYWAAYYASGRGTTDLREVFHGIGK
jgi:tetratricopeptide (TPR) repeat protein